MVCYYLKLGIFGFSASALHLYPKATTVPSFNVIIIIKYTTQLILWSQNNCRLSLHTMCISLQFIQNGTYTG
jgi:hypothetical protein